MRQITKEELQKDATFRYVKFLCECFDQAGIKDQPIEIPMQAVLQANLPSYLPLAWATRIKLLFVLSIYESRGKFGALTEGIKGISYYIRLIAEELGKA